MELLGYVCPSSINLTSGAIGWKVCDPAILIVTSINCVPGVGVGQVGGVEVVGQSGHFTGGQVFGQDWPVVRWYIAINFVFCDIMGKTTTMHKLV